MAKFIQKREYTCFVDFIGYADKDWVGKVKFLAKIAEQKSNQQYLNGFNQKQNRGNIMIKVNCDMCGKEIDYNSDGVNVDFNQYGSVKK